MSGFYGADTEQLRSHAELLVQKAQRVVELEEALTPRVLDEAMWVGSDADEFRSTWSSSLRSLFSDTEERIRQYSEDIEKHAEEQDTASEHDDGGWNPLGLLRDLLLKGQSIYKKIRNIMKYADDFGDSLRALLKLDSIGDLFTKNGKYLDDIFNATGGWGAAAEKLLDKLKIPNGLGELRPFKLLNKLDDVAPWLKTIGKGIGEVVPYVDIVTGGIQAFQGFSSGDIYGGISGTMSSVGGALLVAAPFTGPAAPFLAAAGAGLGVVSAGMDIGRAIYNNWDGITSTVGSIGSGIADVASSAGEAIGNAASTVGEGLSSAASSVGDFLGDAFAF